MLEIILGVIVFISILLIMIIIINNKFQFSIIKIDKAEEDISLYLDKKKELLDRCRPTIKKEFIARIQEEIIQGSYLPLEPDPSLQGLKEKKKAMVKDNQIIQTAETDDEELSLPIPSWIV